jgi:predicted PurR-regulated permease PerM
LQATFSSLLHPQQLLSSFQVASTNLGWFLISIVSVYYFLLDSEKLRAWAFRAVPNAYQRDAQRLYDRIAAVWEAYFRGQIVLMAFVGMLTGVSMTGVGLPGASLIGLLAGIFDIIPSVGPALVALIATIVAFFEGSQYLGIENLWFAVLVLGVFLIIQGLENVWLRPRVMGARLHMHPALIFIGVIGALALSGVLAALLVVPAMSTVGILGHYLLRRILAQDPWEISGQITADEGGES